MFRLENGVYLYFLILVPVVILLYILFRRLRLGNLKKFGDTGLISRLYPDVSDYKHIIKLILILLSLSFLVMGVANPQIGTKVSTVKREGVDVIIALDVSNSMKAEDVKPNRLERAKQMVSRLIDKLQGDRIGIVVFAGEAYVQLPITTDYSAAKLFLSVIDTDIIPVQGTAIGEAIGKAMESFKTEDNKRKALIIITDGENHEDDAVKMAQEAAGNGFVIHTIGMGSIKGSPIPIYTNGNRSGFMKDNEGNIVISKLDVQELQQISTSGNGQFILAGDSDPDLSKLIEKISGMDKKEFESKLFSDYEDRFQFFIAAALIFLVIEVFLSERKNKFLASLNLFSTKKDS